MNNLAYLKTSVDAQIDEYQKKLSEELLKEDIKYSRKMNAVTDEMDVNCNIIEKY